MFLYLAIPLYQALNLSTKLFTVRKKINRNFIPNTEYSSIVRFSATSQLSNYVLCTGIPLLNPSDCTINITNIEVNGIRTITDMTNISVLKKSGCFSLYTTDSTMISYLADKTCTITWNYSV